MDTEPAQLRQEGKEHEHPSKDQLDVTVNRLYASVPRIEPNNLTNH